MVYSRQNRENILNIWLSKSNKQIYKSNKQISKSNILNDWFSKWWHKSLDPPFFPSNTLTNVINSPIHVWRHWAGSAATTGSGSDIWYKSLLNKYLSRLWMASLIEDVEGEKVLGGAASLGKLGTVPAPLQFLQKFLLNLFLSSHSDLLLAILRFVEEVTNLIWEIWRTNRWERLERAIGLQWPWKERFEEKGTSLIKRKSTKEHMFGKNKEENGTSLAKTTGIIRQYYHLNT